MYCNEFGQKFKQSKTNWENYKLDEKLYDDIRSITENYKIN